MLLPKKICNLINGENYEIDDIGMSESSVFIFENKVLKIQENNKEAENEYCMLQYLQGKLPVPLIYAHEIFNGISYLLTSKCEDQMACTHVLMYSCTHENMKNPIVLFKLLANDLKKLWEVDISDCPSNQTLSNKLAMADHNIKYGLVDLDNVEPDIFGKNVLKILLNY